MDDIEHGLELSGKLISELNLMSTDDIASLMHERGIKANRVRSTSCAIAEYLNQEVSQFGIRIDIVSKIYAYIPNRIRIMQWGNSFDLEDFITRFDNGEYPDLIAEKG
jgi:hypothetical protein